MGGALCRDCLWRADGWSGPPPRVCPQCRGRRLVAGPDLLTATIAHVDCDAFYASVEKRDDPSLVTKPVVVGGGQRGVVSAACYVARSFGVRSAMPMVHALRRCPHAVVRKPRMAAYVAASQEIKARFLALTPLVEPLSLDEAFLDLGGTEAVHGAPPAVVLARLALEVERAVGVTVSIGLAPNKFLAKIASDLDKPRGFSLISAQEARGFLATLPVGAIWGVGAATAARLERDGLRLVGDLQRAGYDALAKRYGAAGARLARLAEGLDARRVDPTARRKSVSAETTFGEDTADPRLLEARLWRLCERVADQLKARDLAGESVTLKLKTSAFHLTTRRRTLDAAVTMADPLFRAAAPLLAGALAEPALSHTRFRLIGVGVGGLRAGAARTPAAADLFDTAAPKRAAAEAAMDSIRAKFGRGAIGKGRAIE